MKIYTRTGDDGSTALFGSGRVRKNHPRIEACGSVDEINAALGVAAALLPTSSRHRDILSVLQHDLFDLGADLATPHSSRASVPRIESGHVLRLEQAIDTHEAELEPLRNFILPGGSPAAAMLHLARTVCRRAERQLARTIESEHVSPLTLEYVNRLSDLLFVLARHVNHSEGHADVIWNPKRDH